MSHKTINDNKSKLPKLKIVIISFTKANKSTENGNVGRKAFYVIRRSLNYPSQSISLKLLILFCTFNN